MAQLTERQLEEAKEKRERNIDKDLLLAAGLSLFLKLRLESRLTRKLRKKYNIFIRKVYDNYIKYGHSPSIEEFQEGLKAVLNEHYIDVADKFDEFARAALPEIINEELLNEKLQSLIEYNAINRADWASGVITGTLNDDIERTLKKILLEAALAGAVLTRRQAARKLRAKLKKLSKGRIDNISVTETQIAAERTKRDEVFVIIQNETEFKDETAIFDYVRSKIWIAILDERTRPAHVEADGQIKPFDEPFIVDNEELMYPRDTDRGASPENVMGCRCDAQYFFQRLLAR